MYLFDHTIKNRDFCFSVETTIRRFLSYRVEHEAKNHASHEGTL